MQNFVLTGRCTLNSNLGITRPHEGLGGHWRPCKEGTAEGTYFPAQEIMLVVFPRKGRSEPNTSWVLEIERKEGRKEKGLGIMGDWLGTWH